MNHDTSLVAPARTQIHNSTTKFIDRYSSLVEHVQRIIFPYLRTGFMAPVDMSGWPRLRRVLYRLSMTGIWLRSSSNLPLLYLWVFFALLIFQMFDIALKFFIGGVRFPPSSLTNDARLDRILLGVVLVVLVTFGLANIWTWFEILRDDRIRLRWRILIFLIFLILYFTIPFWGMESGYRTKFFELLFQQAVRGRFLLLYSVLLIFPAFSFVYRVTITELLFPVFWLLSLFNKYFSTFHNPVSRSLIQSLLSEPISDSINQVSYYFKDLPLLEIKFLREWATSNRESTDKRLIPTALFFSLLGLIANLDFINTSINNFFLWLLEIFDQTANKSFWSVYGRLWLWILIILLILYLLRILLPMFVNIMTQSIIIETCLVIEYERSLKINTANKGWKHFFNKLFRK